MPSGGQAGTSTPPSSEGKWSGRFRKGFDKSIVVSDWASGYANAISAKVGGERFWPKSNDMPLEIEKCERILRAFTVEGIPQKEDKEEKVQDGKGNWITKKRKVLRKIPPSAIKNAKGVAIYSSMRSGIAPFGGGGGAGLVLVRLPDGSWSAPSAISPNNLSTGLLLGVDFIDAVLLINSDAALESFLSHKFTIGAETGLTAGPYGTGASAESGFERAPIYSYVRTRGAYAGVEIMGQVFLHRFDENERFYYWPGITARDILTGKVKMPPLVYPLHRALRDAEMGVAQGGKLETVLYDVVKMPESEVMKILGPKKEAASAGKRFVAGGSGSNSVKGSQSQTPVSSVSRASTPTAGREGEEQGKGLSGDLDGLTLEDANSALGERGEKDDDEEDFVKEGERLKLPPTPEELEMLERAGIPDEEDLKFEREARKKIYEMPPPPMHANVQRYWRVRPEKAAKRPTKQLVMDGPHSAELREAQFVRLPSSPRSSIVQEEDAEPLQSLQDTTKMEEEKARAEAGDVPGEEGVLLSSVSEEEADKLMRAVANGEDVTGVEGGVGKEWSKAEEGESGVSSKHGTVVDLASADQQSVEPIETDQHSDHRREEEVPKLEEADKRAPIEKEGEGQEQNERTPPPRAAASLMSATLSSSEPASDSAQSSPRPSISEGGTTSPPSRPPRTRPPPRRKVK